MTGTGLQVTAWGVEVALRAWVRQATGVRLCLGRKPATELEPLIQNAWHIARGVATYLPIVFHLIGPVDRYEVVDADRHVLWHELITDDQGEPIRFGVAGDTFLLTPRASMSR